MFNGKCTVSTYRTTVYTSDGVTYRVDWRCGLVQVWHDWPRRDEPVLEATLGQ